MQALHWNGTHLKLDLSYPPPKADKVMALIRVRLAGICSTDLQIFKGYMGFQGVPGHEFVGEVREGPSGLVGKRVVGEINFACGPLSPALAVRMGYPQPSGAMLPIMTEDYLKSVLLVSDHPKAAGADPKDFFDNRFLKELEGTCFVHELYGGR